MHGSFTLIKRQIVDNAAFFLAAVIFSVVLVIAIVSIAFSEDITYLSSYTIMLIIFGPVLFGIGSYILGLVQVHSDKNRGVTAVLSVLPVTPGRILFARLVTGSLIILTLLGPPAITGAILWKFLGPPEWLFHNWLGDVFIGLALSSLACYCLGLYVARRAGTFASALRGLLLVPIIMLLIVIKGFDQPLLVVLLPFLAVSLFRCRKHDSNGFITNIATGFTVLVLLAVPLYFGRNICDGLLVTKMKAIAKVSPSGLLSMEIENDPNVVDYSEVIGRMNLPVRLKHCTVCNLLDSCHLFTSDHFEASHYLIQNLGIIKYLKSRNRGTRIAYADPFSNSPQSRINIIHLDKVNGQLVYRRTTTDTREDLLKNHWKDVEEIYAGPEGVSSDPNTIGRFSSPIVNFDPGSLEPYRSSMFPCIVYNKDSRCFYTIDLDRKIVRKGPEVSDSSLQPADLGFLPNSDSHPTVGFYLPSTKDYKYRSPSHVPKAIVYLPIVDVTGRIYLLDLRTLTLISSTNHLPRPRTIFGRASSKPRDLLDYDIDVIWLIPSRTRLSTRLIAGKTKGGYMGYITASVSRQGMWTSVSVFDKDGKEIRTADSKSTFFDTPGGPVLTIAKYIFESLHPPVLTLTSYFTAYSFEARSAHRALFLMPNSFVAMAGDYEGNIFYTILIVLLLMLPGILFACILGWRVARDGAKIGLSRNARRFWLAGTLVFGLAGYITYRITRPKVIPVTCTNCGNLRRPDMDLCHRCGNKWDVPELKPPKWRIISRAKEIYHSLPAEEME